MNGEELKTKGHGLLPLPEDPRDFSHQAVHGAVGTALIPNVDFTVYDALGYSIKNGDTLSALATLFGVKLTDFKKANPQIVDLNKIYVGQPLTIPSRGIIILDQTDLDFCTAFCKCEIAYQIFGVEFDPYYFMAKIKQVRGEFSQYGASLRDAALASVRYGFLPKVLAPFSHNTGGPNDKTRDFLACWANYPLALDAIAKKYKLGSFFKVDGPGDAYDNIRAVMWTNRYTRRSVDFGLNWRPEWTNAPGGIIKDSGYVTSSGEGHDGNFIGQIMFKGETEPRLVFQQTWGEGYGDKGKYYFPRSVVNKEAKSGYGMFTYAKMSAGLASYFIDNGIQVGDSWLTVIWKVLCTLVKDLIALFKKNNG